MKDDVKTTAPITGLALLREPFPAHQISKLPKGTKAQNDCPASEKVNCKVCGGWHHPRVIHLDYVGHAALCDRLLDTDPNWNWEPLALGQDGTPVIDKDGGMWIRLTVCGVTRLGYGDAQGKTGGNATKERIGDALRNAAMRFGAALDLWHKGDLHLDDEPDPLPVPKTPKMREGYGTDSIDRSLKEEPQHTSAPLTTLNDEQIAIIEALASEVNVDTAKICEKAHVNKLADIPMIAYQSIISKLELTRKTA